MSKKTRPLIEDSKKIPTNTPISLDSKNKKSPFFSVKTLILGPHDSGCTSVLDRFIKGTFSERTHLTIGADCRNIEVNNISFQIWDMGGFKKGERRYCDLFYRNTQIILMLFGVECKSHYEAIENVDDLIEEMRAKARPNLYLFLVGNKIDWAQFREIQTQQGEELAKKIHADGYFECSAKTGEGVSEIFDNIVQFHKNKFMPLNCITLLQGHRKNNNFFAKIPIALINVIFQFLHGISERPDLLSIECNLFVIHAKIFYTTYNRNEWYLKTSAVISLNKNLGMILNNEKFSPSKNQENKIKSEINKFLNYTVFSDRAMALLVSEVETVKLLKKKIIYVIVLIWKIRD